MPTTTVTSTVRGMSRAPIVSAATPIIWPATCCTPLQAVVVLYPLFLASLRRLRSRRPGVWRYCLRQYAAWLGLWGGLLALDPGKAFWLVIVPQLHGLHWLLATNYLQHAHADGAGASRGAELRTQFRGLGQPVAVQHWPAHGPP